MSAIRTASIEMGTDIGHYRQSHTRFRHFIPILKGRPSSKALDSVWAIINRARRGVGYCQFIYRSCLSHACPYALHILTRIRLGIAARRDYCHAENWQSDHDRSGYRMNDKRLMQ
ncbi:MAG: hypothetical protein GX307_04270 [Euryarchaeota archaeon]|nr:hypothetical protein [Euryarchaeota archaeon]